MKYLPSLRVAPTERKSVCCLLAVIFGVIAQLAVADETKFPSRHRTLETVAPAHCSDWLAPLPDRRVKVTLPREARNAEGSAHLTIVISPTGEFAGLVEAIANDAAFVRAATDSLQFWSFIPARCNGAAVAAQSKIFFNFRSDTLVSFVSDGRLQ